MRLKYAFIKQLSGDYSIRRLCLTLKVHPSGYYAWLSEPKSARAKEDQRLLGLIKHSWLESGGVYGYRKIHDDLREVGESCGRHRVARLMRFEGLRSQTGYRRRPGKSGGKPAVASPNLLKRQFDVREPNKVWVTDITYIRTYEGWLYLAVVLDLFSRQVVGWSMKPQMTSDLAIDALLMAVWRRKPKQEVMVHSDQGSQEALPIRYRFAHARQATPLAAAAGNPGPAANYFFDLLTIVVYSEKNRLTGWREMPVLLDDIKGYLESTVGLEAHLQAATGLKVPFHIKDAYKLVYLALMVGPKSKQKLPMLLLLPVENKYPGAVTLGKHIAQVQKATDKVVVYVCRSLSVPERRSLIANNINFIQPGYQMFIPELAMDLRERVRTRRNEGEVSALLPAAQAMVLGCLYEGWDSDTIYTSNGIMGEFNYSRVTLSKVIDQLLKLHIIHPAQSRGFTNTYSFDASPTGVFKKARHFMRSPVKRKVAIDKVLHTGNGVFLAGETALAKYTMLAGPVQPVFGMTKKQFDAMVEEKEFKVTDSVDEIRAWVEIWAYRSLTDGKNIADEASLLLSLEDNPDERVQLALDDLKEKVTWLRSED